MQIDTNCLSDVDDLRRFVAPIEFTRRTLGVRLCVPYELWQICVYRPKFEDPLEETPHPDPGTPAEEVGQLSFAFTEDGDD